jgi:hypothetical protein
MILTLTGPGGRIPLSPQALKTFKSKRFGGFFVLVIERWIKHGNSKMFK